MLPRIRAKALQPASFEIGRESLEQAGVDPDAFAQPDAQLSLAVADRVWTKAGPERALKVAAGVRAATYGHYTYLLAACPTLGDLLRCAAGYYALLSEGVRMVVDVGARGTRLELRMHEPDRRPEASELFMAATVSEFIRRHAPGASPRSIDLRQSASPATAARWSSRLGVSVRAGRRRTALEWPTSSLTTPVRTAEPQLARLLERHANNVLHAAEPELAPRVRACIQDSWPHCPDAPSVAGSMGLSVRSLRRQLRAEGTGLREMVDNVRGELAAARLRQPGATVRDAADAAGFSDLAAFRRAFRRWFKMTPAAYRGTVALSQISA